MEENEKTILNSSRRILVGRMRKPRVSDAFSQKSTCKFDPDEGQQNDQFAPFFVSSKGRYIWSERPFILRVEAGTIICEGKEEILLKDGYVTLRDAYLAACHAHFPFTNSLPDKRFFTQPQYNT